MFIIKNIFNFFFLEKIKIFLEILKYNCLEIITEYNFIKNTFEKIFFKKNLKIKLGIDPTTNKIHLGHISLINKVLQLQKLKFIIIILIGGQTSLIGDLIKKNNNITEIKNNIESYIKQIKYLIIKFKNIKIYYNNEWLKLLNLEDLIFIFSFFTILQIFKKNNIKNRYLKKDKISINEIIYSIFQAYDSLFINPDVEIGGLDQKINFILTKNFQKKFKNYYQTILLFPLLVGIDGEKKMSKSINNIIYLYFDIFMNFENFMKISNKLLENYLYYLSFKKKKFIEKNNRSKKLLILELIERFYNRKIFFFFLNKYLKKKKNIFPEFFNKVKLKCLFIIIFFFLKLIKIFESSNKSIFHIKQKNIKINGILIENYNLYLLKGKYILQYKKYYFQSFFITN